MKWQKLEDLWVELVREGHPLSDLLGEAIDRLAELEERDVNRKTSSGTRSHSRR
jgi:hypothetical protein